MDQWLRHKPTGKIRYRLLQRWFRRPLLVLQIEVEGFVEEYSPVSIDGSIQKYWIDAELHMITPTDRDNNE